MTSTLDPEYLALFPGPLWVDCRGVSKLPIGPGHSLWEYWTKGKGLAQWGGSAKKWTTLHALLKAAGVPAKSLDGLTTNIIDHVFPGYMKTVHGKKQKSG